MRCTTHYLANFNARYITRARAYYGALYGHYPAVPARGTPLMVVTNNYRANGYPHHLNSSAKAITNIVRDRVHAALIHAQAHWGYRSALQSLTALASSSLRRGMATWMEACGLTEEERMQHGRWLSTVNRRYVEWARERTGTLPQRC